MQRVFKKPNNSGRRPKMSNFQNNSRPRLSGAKFVPSDDPPVIAGQPWNSIIVDTSFALGTGSFAYFKLKELHACLLNQCGFNNAKSVEFEVRLQSVSLWSVETGNVQYSRLCVMIMDMFNDNSVELIRLDSNSMKNKYSKIGYYYPLSHSSAPIKVLPTSDAILISAQSSVAATGILHLKVLCRGLNAGFKINAEKWIRITVPSASLDDSDDNDDNDEFDKIDGIGNNLSNISISK